MSNKYDEVLRQNLALEKSVISLEKKKCSFIKRNYRGYLYKLFYN